MVCWTPPEAFVAPIAGGLYGERGGIDLHPIDLPDRVGGVGNQDTVLDLVQPLGTILDRRLFAGLSGRPQRCCQSRSSSITAAGLPQRSHLTKPNRS